MDIFDEFEELDNEEIEQIKQGLRQQFRILILGLEVFWEELQKSNLPEELKLKLLENYKGNKGE
jgi:hypothetical protein